MKFYLDMEEFFKSKKRCNSCPNPPTLQLSLADAPTECTRCSVNHVTRDSVRSLGGTSLRRRSGDGKGITKKTRDLEQGERAYSERQPIVSEFYSNAVTDATITEKLEDLKRVSIVTPPSEDQDFQAIHTPWLTETTARHKLELGGVHCYGSSWDTNGVDSNLRKQSSRSTTSIFTTVTVLCGPEGDGGDGPCSSSEDEKDRRKAVEGSDDGGKPEAWWNTLCQVAVPFFLAGSGTLGAGLVLDKVQKWSVFTDISAIFVLVPALLGLKGNLDTCLASRLSTLANMGKLGKWEYIFPVVWGNIALVQVQATVAGFLVSLFAIAVGVIMYGDFPFKHGVVLCASSVATATCCCFALDFLLISVIIISKKLHMNPDNMAAPVAASLGDIMSLSLLSLIASALYEYHDLYPWMPLMIVGVFLLALLPMWVYLVLRNEYVKAVLTFGWAPILSALFISGMGGLVLDSMVTVYNGFVVFQPIISGIGGNLVSIQSSRISTMLHQTSLLGILPPHSPSVFVSPWKALITGLPHAATARILLGFSIPGHLVFIFAADYLHAGESTLTWQFVMTYLAISSLQIGILLYLVHVLVHIVWKRKIDPDSATIPYLTSFSDLVGSGFLALDFMFLYSVGKGYTG